MVSAPKPTPMPAEAAAETAPLLGPNASSKSDAAQVRSNGTFTGADGSRPHGDENGTGGQNITNDPESGANGQAPSRDGPKIQVNMAALLPALAIGIFLVALDQTLTIATYGKMGSDLRALNSTSWIATSYFLTLTTFQPLYGKLSDIFGRKECLLFAYTVFGLGCLGCGLARDITQLCVARAVAGVGGGGMNALVSILVTDLVSLRDRGVWQGYINVVFAAGVASGAPIGGLMADSVGWRWAFLGQFPISMLAFISVYFVLSLPKSADVDAKWSSKILRIDFLGAFTLVAAVFLLLFGLDNGANRGWSHTSTIVPLALTPFLLALFILIEVKVAAHPFAPGHVILDPPLLAAYGANLFGVAAQLGVYFFVALFLQAALGYSATHAGLLFVPTTFFGLAGSLGGGWLLRRFGKYYWLTFGGYALVLLSCVPLVAFSGVVATSATGVVVGLSMMGLGSGCSITTTLIAVIANSAPEDMAIAIACSYLFRSLGTSLGIGISTAVLQQTLRTTLADALADGGRAAEIETRVRESLDYIRTLEPAVAAVVRRCYAVATQHAFAPIAVFAALALLSSWFVREKKLER